MAFVVCSTITSTEENMDAHTRDTIRLARLALERAALAVAEAREILAENPAGLEDDDPFDDDDDDDDEYPFHDLLNDDPLGAIVGEIEDLVSE